MLFPKSEKRGSILQNKRQKESPHLQWRSSVADKWRMMEGICEVCGLAISQEECVGHHKFSRKHNDHSVYNSEVRHIECERNCHAKYPFGNMPYKDRPGAVKRQYRNIRNRISTDPFLRALFGSNKCFKKGNHIGIPNKFRDQDKRARKTPPK